VTSCVSCKRANQLRQWPLKKLSTYHVPAEIHHPRSRKSATAPPEGDAVDTLEAETGIEPAYTALQAAA
jgi:hypothetical protein